MIAKKTRGRPSLGERHAFSTRIPIGYAEKVVDAANAAGVPYGEYLSRLVCLAIDSGLDRSVRDELSPQIRNQRALIH